MEYIYASLLLHMAKKEISEENVRRVLEAAGVEVDDIKVKAAPAEAKEEKKEEEKKEEEKKEEVSEEEIAAGLEALFG
ncbi:MAG: 50S ribosomal protein P1 [Desulfurococcales archaeon ex4484_217_1]|nr:MAG: 50S ribosomal protein P1 [Desulfurococcales archaeon ex4484_217_1]